MSVFKRGKKHYHYRFMVRGKTYSGNTGKTTKDEAIRFENDVRGKIISSDSVGEAVRKLQDHLIGDQRILLEDGFDRWLLKPAKRKPNAKTESNKRSYWRDFCAFMQATEPRVQYLHEVTFMHAESYIHHIRTFGRFEKKRQYQKSRKKWQKRPQTVVEYTPNKSIQRLSSSAANRYLETCKGVFTKLKRDASIEENPFGEIERLPIDGCHREAFTDEQIRKLLEPSNRSPHPVGFHIAMVGLYTGLRKKDISLLRWANFRNDGPDGALMLNVRTSKKKRPVRFPVLPELEDYLRSLPETDQYIFPELAAMYEINEGGVTDQFHKFIEDILNVNPTMEVEGRDRAVTVYGIHSLRNSFITLAGVCGVALPFVQQIVGHLSQDMTRLYYRGLHDRQCMAELNKMRSTLIPASVKPQLESTDLRELLETTDDLNTIRLELLKITQTVTVARATVSKSAQK